MSTSHNKRSCSLQSAQRVEVLSRCISERLRRTPPTIAGRPNRRRKYRTARAWNAGKITKGADRYDESRGAVKLLGPSGRPTRSGSNYPQDHQLVTSHRSPRGLMSNPRARLRRASERPRPATTHTRFGVGIAGKVPIEPDRKETPEKAVP
jgi:hypothetical protein